MKFERMIELLEIEKECVNRNNQPFGKNCDRQCSKCDLVQNTDELLEMYDMAITLLKSSIQTDWEYKVALNQLEELGISLGEKYWYSFKEHGFPKEDGKYLVIEKITDRHYVYKILDYSNNLYKVDKYDFLKSDYYNKKGFYAYEECGYYEVEGVLCWAKLPRKAGDINVLD